MKKYTLLLLIKISFIANSFADEGMWLPYYINKLMGNMQQYGCKLTADQIYNANQSSMKDAIVHFGGFCTGEIVSNQGLVFTNHHCGYDAISTLSTAEANHLDNGFWATDFAAEIPAPGLTASMLVYMSDVTERMANATDKAAEIKKIKEEATAGNHYKADVKSFFYGNEYYLLVYEVFKDIRLVGTPPQNIGKFGGDTDNWMWPRHTGDFSIFRIYASADNKPAEYSVNNVPYKPKHFIPLNLKGIKENDFAMIMGFPGRTTRYLTNAGVKNVAYNRYPILSQVLKEKLQQWWSEMSKDVNVRLTLSGDYASLANSQKYFDGVMNALKSSPCLNNKTELETDFIAWVNSSEEKKKQYGSVISDLQKLYDDNKTMTGLSQYMRVAYNGVKFAEMGSALTELKTLLSAKEIDMTKLAEAKKNIKENSREYFKYFIKPVEQKVFASMLRIVHKNLEEKYWVSNLKSKEFSKMKGDSFQSYAAYVLNSSMLADSVKFFKFLEKPSLAGLQKDPGAAYVLDVVKMMSELSATFRGINEKEEQLMKVYVKGLREFKGDKFFYPDANSTLRITYGQVKPYSPKDGIKYNWYTTHKGILEKEKPGDPEFDVPSSFSKALKKGSFGKYADASGDLPVAFICNLDITGGNSGSPVIDGNGSLIGIAFDGVWEGMVGDLYWEPSQNRTIAVDIRYVMYVVEQMSGSDRIYNEVKTNL